MFEALEGRLPARGRGGVPCESVSFLMDLATAAQINSLFDASKAFSIFAVRSLLLDARATLFCILCQYYVGHCPLSDVTYMYLIHTTFRLLSMLPSSGD
jgi:hypothetical protein